jgi:hypothetical protein
MSSPAPGVKQSQVVIADDSSNPRKLVLDNQVFWVSKKLHEVAEWFCHRNHPQNFPCFTVTFNKNGSPFASPGPFTPDSSGHAKSDAIVVSPGPTIYDYVN